MTNLPHKDVLQISLQGNVCPHRPSFEMSASFITVNTLHTFANVNFLQKGDWSWQACLVLKYFLFKHIDSFCSFVYSGGKVSEFGRKCRCRKWSNKHQTPVRGLWWISQKHLVAIWGCGESCGNQWLCLELIRFWNIDRRRVLRGAWKKKVAYKARLWSADTFLLEIHPKMQWGLAELSDGY